MVREFEGTNQWALILGGSSGLGLATARKLASLGLNLFIVHRNARSQMDYIEQAFQEIRDLGITCVNFNKDALQVHRREEIVTEMKAVLGPDGTIKTLIHSLAKGNLKPMVAQNEPVLKSDDFELTIKAMAISLYDWTKDLHNHQLFGTDARIVAFTSEGNTKAWHHYAAVSAAKVVLEALTRNIALEFAEFGIKANCIQAGVTDTPSLRMIPGSELLIEQSLKRNPNQRLTRPEDVADVVSLLLKKEAAWITGTVIPVDGGEHLR